MAINIHKTLWSLCTRTRVCKLSSFHVMHWAVCRRIC